MDKIKRSLLFRSISLALIVTFIALDVSYAYPPEHNAANSTLAIPSVLQQTPVNEPAARFQQSVSSQSALITSVFDIGEYFFGNAGKSIGALPAKYAEEAIRADLWKHLRDADTDILNIVPVEYIKKTAPEKLKAALDEIGFKGRLPDEGVVFILYKKGDKKFLVQIARKDQVSSDNLPGYEWAVSDKYVVKYVPENYEEPVKEKANTLLALSERTVVDKQGQVIMDFLATRESYDAKSSKWTPVLSEDALVESGPFDAMLVLGSSDERVPKEAAIIAKKLRAQNPKMTIITSGKWGDHVGATGNYIDHDGKRMPEAEHFKRVMESLGTNVDLVEDRSTNSGQNIQFSRDKLRENGLMPARILIIQAPELQLRAGRSLVYQYPEKYQTLDSMGVQSVTSYSTYIPDISSMTDEQALSRVQLAISELQRLPDYSGRFMMPVEIPPTVLEAEKALQAIVEGIEIIKNNAARDDDYSAIESYILKELAMQREMTLQDLFVLVQSKVTASMESLTSALKELEPLSKQADLDAKEISQAIAQTKEKYKLSDEETKVLWLALTGPEQGMGTGDSRQGKKSEDPTTQERRKTLDAVIDDLGLLIAEPSIALQENFDFAVKMLTEEEWRDRGFAVSLIPFMIHSNKELATKPNLSKARDMLKNVRPIVRIYGLHAIAAFVNTDRTLLDSEEILNEIKDKALDKVAAVREAALQVMPSALGRFAPEENMVFLLGMLKDKNAAVRYYALEAMLVIVPHNKAVVTETNLYEILNMMRDSDRRVRAGALEVISSFSKRELAGSAFTDNNLSLVSDMLNSKNAGTRESAVYAIHSFIHADKKYATADNLNKVLLLIRDKNHKVRYAASSVTPPIFGAANKSSMTRNNLDLLREMERDTGKAVRKSAQIAISYFLDMNATLTGPGQGIGDVQQRIETLKMVALPDISDTKTFPAVGETYKSNQLFEIVESSLSTERAKFIDAGNKIAGGIDKNMATAEIRQRVEKAIENASVASLPRNDGDVEFLKKNLAQFEADGGFGSMIVLARKAKKENQKLIIGLETDWIPGMDLQNSLQRQAISALMKEIDNIAEALQSMGLDNVEIVRGKSDQLADTVLNEAEKTHTKMHNIVVMASAGTINSAGFASLRNADESDRPFLTGIDPTELIKLYTEFGEVVSSQLYIRLASLLYMTLELAAGKEPPQSPMIISYDKKLRILILLPRAEPMDYEALKSNYAAEKSALQAA